MSNEIAAAALASPSLNLSFDLSRSVFFQRNDQNFILQQFAGQTPMLQNMGLLDIYLSRGHSVEAHWHPNAAEFVYMVQGEAIISVLNPFTLQVLTYRLKNPQTIYIPMGWWHWEIATEDRTHMLAFFDNSMVQTVFGSDVLRKTPPEVFQLIYGVNAAQLAHVLKPIDQTVVIGPPSTRGA
ncbi:cupin domain-containing protein [Cohnella luojiensis]|uniref:Cupin domain-containing protein n=1 Tax=Cohnella luojiensis TaxID=652876 RepID=A0A4Y8LP64_9BACL|nr:cupin domain-containing protein [Cohnella luojiensis]TFE22795.1 cupin domain-containing protein [Cohnella luojiensis]